MLSFSHEDNQIDNPNLYDCDLLSNEESLEPWEIKPEIDLEDPKYKNLKHALQFAEMDYYVFPVPDIIVDAEELSYQLLNSSSDKETITEKWVKDPDLSIGIPTHYYSFYVLEADEKGRSLLSKFGEIPDTLSYEEGNGTIQYYFKSEEHLKCVDLLTGVKFIGEGGYSVMNLFNVDIRKEAVPVPVWLTDLIRHGIVDNQSVNELNPVIDESNLNPIESSPVTADTIPVNNESNPDTADQGIDQHMMATLNSAVDDLVDEWSEQAEKKGSDNPASTVEPIKTEPVSSPDLPFWNFNNDRPGINEIKLMEFLEGQGIIRVDGSKYARIQKGFIEDIDDIQIKDLVMDYLRQHDEPKVLALVHKQSDSLFAKKKLTTIRSRKVSYIRDEKRKVHLFFKNGALVINENEMNLVPYTDFTNRNLFVHKEHILNHDFEYDQSTGMYEEFVGNTSSYTTPEDSNTVPNEQDYFLRQSDLQSKILTLGYLCSRYKDPSQPKCIIATDATLNDQEINGRTGKSLFIKALGYVRSLKSFDGKRINIKDRFSLQGLTHQHQLINIDDVGKDFNFEQLFHMVSGDMNFENKYAGRVSIAYKDSPKIAITTNQPLYGDGSSFSGRQHIIEFSNFYNEERSPEIVHGMNLFEDWQDKEWNRFYSFMARCIQAYLEAGELKAPKVRNYALNKLGSYLVGYVWQGNRHA